MIAPTTQRDRLAERVDLLSLEVRLRRQLDHVAIVRRADRRVARGVDGRVVTSTGTHGDRGCGGRQHRDQAGEGRLAIPNGGGDAPDNHIDRSHVELGVEVVWRGGHFCSRRRQMSDEQRAALLMQAMEKLRDKNPAASSFWIRQQAEALVEKKMGPKDPPPSPPPPSTPPV